MKGNIDIQVRLNAKTFRRFCWFDTFSRQNRWYWPVLISMLLITASLAGIFGWVAMSGTFSGLLMGLGISVLMINLGLYVVSVEAQVARQHLKDAPLVYTLRLGNDGVRVINRQKEETPVDLPWNKLWAAFRPRDDVYLYVNPARALILPEGQANVSNDALWSFIKAHLGAEKCSDGRSSPS